MFSFCFAKFLQTFLNLLIRIDDLEKSISDLMTQAGVEGHQHMGDK